MINTPVLFLIFNRKEPTRKVFEQIRIAKPKKLYIAADGPRKSREDDPRKCAETREIVKNIDWECEVKTLFRDENLGCRVAVSSAITWFFDNEEMGIILEDDCLPDQTFFSFCEENLIKYKDDERIMLVSGTNFQEGNQRGKASYYFSRFYNIWGWASWKRAWVKYDVDLKDYPKFLKSKGFENIYPNDPILQKFWIDNLNLVYKENFNTWDYQWAYTMMKNNALSIVPNNNLIKNIGFDPKEATHTVYVDVKEAKMVTKPIKKIVHPEFIVPNYEADLFARVNHYYLPLPNGQLPQKSLAYRAARKVYRMGKKIIAKARVSTKVLSGK